MSDTIVQRYHELLYAVLDPGMLDKRTDHEAHEKTLACVRREKGRLEELHYFEKACREHLTPATVTALWNQSRYYKRTSGALVVKLPVDR